MAEVVIALDAPGRSEALALVERLGPDARFYKVGLELFTRVGPGIVKEIQSLGCRVFLDLKLHDIPNTVAGAARAAADLGVDLLTVHSTGGRKMIAAARAAVEGSPTRILAVTVLTSLDESGLSEAWGRSNPNPRVEVVRLAAYAIESGAHGVVAAAAEATALRERLGQGVILATPGIRPAGAAPHDQARIATPGAATRAGADYLVVGRSVAEAPDPRASLLRIRAEVEAA